MQSLAKKITGNISKYEYEAELGNLYYLAIYYYCIGRKQDRESQLNLIYLVIHTEIWEGRYGPRHTDNTSYIARFSVVAPGPHTARYLSPNANKYEYTL